MRIISKYHDYYDTALGYGLDPKLVWLRKESESEIASVPAIWDLGHRVAASGHAWGDYRSRRVYAKNGILIFCGRYYPFIQLEDFACTHPQRVPSEVAWSLDDVQKFVSRFPAKVQRSIRNDWGWQNLRRTRLEDAFRSSGADIMPADVHRGLGSPVFRITKQTPGATRWGVAVNPVLKDLGFMRVVVPFAAFQDISMYLGGVMGQPEMEHDPIPDEAMRDMKGFDDKSFKTLSPGKKRKRRNKR